MKILIHDYHGTPPHFDMSKFLSKKGYTIIHGYNPECGGPKTGFGSQNNGNLKILEVTAGDINKNNFFKRYIQEKRYGKKIVNNICKNDPDIVISANTPTDAEKQIINYCQSNSIPHIFWLTDLRSIAIYKILADKLGLIGRIIGKYYINMEKKLLNRSSHIIYLNDAFKRVLNKWNIRTSKDFLPIWAPIDDIGIYPKKNEFSKKYELDNKFVILYSGSFGFKHNPEMIYQAANKLRSKGDIKFVVISEDRGADYLENMKKQFQLDNLLLLPYQDYDIFPKVLASADILLTILNNSAAEFSVPSKVYSGFCSGRASILAVHRTNLASRVVNNNELGIVTPPDDPEGLVEAILYLKNNPDKREKYAKNARNYAEDNFKIERIASKFEKVFRDLVN